MEDSCWSWYGFVYGSRSGKDKDNGKVPTFAQRLRRGKQGSRLIYAGKLAQVEHHMCLLRRFQLGREGLRQRRRKAQGTKAPQLNSLRCVSCETV